MVDYFRFKGKKVLSTVFQLFFKDGVVGPREVDDIFKHIQLAQPTLF